MKSVVLVGSILLFGVAPAAAANVSGNGALALAALVGQKSPHLTSAQKSLLRKYLAGHAKPHHPHVAAFSVKADAITCRASNVDITTHSCELTFGPKKRSLSGRPAHELYATLIENGVASDGAAGSIFEATGALNCPIDPVSIADRAGGGASCTIAPAP
ncbi:MAG TPA: hypothetical protein VMU18_09195 [Rhodoblastus sp.]|nr:hypothetical protein [Rhodoblastus sp.]